MTVHDFIGLAIAGMFILAMGAIAFFDWKKKW